MIVLELLCIAYGIVTMCFGKLVLSRTIFGPRWFSVLGGTLICLEAGVFLFFFV